VVIKQLKTENMLIHWWQLYCSVTIVTADTAFCISW